MKNEKFIRSCCVAVVLAIATFLLYGGIVLGFQTSNSVVLADNEISVWTGEADTSWYEGHEDDSEFTLTSASQLAGLSSLSSTGTTFESQTIFLGVDIDLNGCKSLSVEYNKSQAITNFTDADTHNVWTPIINFQGTFNGNGHTIYNMSVKEGRYAEGQGYDSGFISYLASGTLKNITFDGAIVSGTKNVGVAVGKCESGTIRSVSVENSKILLGNNCAGGVVGVATSVVDCSVRGLQIDCSLGGTKLIGGIIGAGAADNADSATASVVRGNVFNFEILNGENLENVGLFAGNKTTVGLTNCATNITNIALSSGEFDVEGEESVTYQNIEGVTIDGTAAENSGEGFVNHSFDAEGKQGKVVAITFVAKPSSIQIVCTGADAPTHTQNGRVASFTIPETASSITLTAEMLGADDVTAVFTVGEYVPPTPTPTPITIEIDDKTSAYGDDILLLTASVVSGELKDGDDLYSVVTLAKESGDSVGTYDIVVSASDENYDVTWEPATYTITQKQITVEIDDKTSAYGDDILPLTASVVSGELKDGDDLYSVVTLAKESGDSVGTYDIVVSASDENYDVTWEPATYTITQRQITVEIDDKESAYGEAFATLTAKLTSGTLASGDELSDVVNLQKEEGNNVSSYAITLSVINDNYSVSYEPATYAITQRQITVEIDDKESVYGDTLATLTAKLTSGTLANGDELADVVNLQKEDGNNVSSYAITLSVIDGNYAVSYEPATYTITQRQITVEIDDKESVYGEAFATLTAKLTSGTLANGDELTDVVNLQKEEGNDVATYAITLSVINDNYSVSYKPATYTINQRQITVEINDKESVYGDTLAPLSAKLTSGTLASGDELTDVVTLEKAEGNLASTYDITLTCNNSNYNVDWACGTYTIKQRPITLVVEDKTSVYGEDFEELTAKVTGLAGGDDESVLSIVLEKAEGKAVGEYVINGGILNQNYIVSDLTKGKYTISPRPIAVKVADAESVFGDDLKPIVLTLTTGTLVYGDTLEKIVSTTTPLAASGMYNITAKAESDNYAITFEYTHEGHSVYEVVKKDVSSRIFFTIEPGETIVSGESVLATIDVAGIDFVYVLTLDGVKAENTKGVGEYTLVAKIDNPNYAGEKSITFFVIENAGSKVKEIERLVGIYTSPLSTDEQKINALFDAQGIYADLTEAELAEIESNAEYKEAVDQFVSAWNDLKQGAEKDMQVATKTYDKTISILIGAVTAAYALAFIVMKSLLH